MPRKKGRMWLGCRAAGLQGLVIVLGVCSHPSALWGRPEQRNLGLKHRVAAPCLARSRLRGLPGSLLPGRVMGGSVWSSEGGVCQEVTKFLYMAFLALKSLSGDKNAFYFPGIGRMLSHVKFISSFQGTKKGQSILASCFLSNSDSK